ncbi:IS200/IS605 family transposase [Halorubrum sp. Atlit-28R]|uniref:IS200/IS605 family transposase n=1 Tax=Halorubrum sp. Atlit-28R TaxID=2282129 RepID=UPI0018F758C7
MRRDNGRSRDWIDNEFKIVLSHEIEEKAHDFSRGININYHTRLKPSSMGDRRYTASSTHFVWCPKHRKPVLTDEAANHLEQLIEEKASELALGIPRLAIQPDHVHLFITNSPKLTPIDILLRVNAEESRAVGVSGL